MPLTQTEKDALAALAAKYSADVAALAVDPAPSGNPAPMSDFQARVATLGTHCINTFRFDNTDDRYNLGVAMNDYKSGKYGPHDDPYYGYLGYGDNSYGYQWVTNRPPPDIDRTIVPSGGALRFTFQPYQGASAGKWVCFFDRFNKFQAGPGQQVFIQFKYRQDGMASDPKAHGNGVKLVMVQPQTELEDITLIHCHAAYRPPYPTLYMYPEGNSGMPGPQCVITNGAGDQSTYGPLQDTCWDYAPPGQTNNCWRTPDNEWIWFQIGIQIGTTWHYQTTDGNYGHIDASLQMWVTRSSDMVTQRIVNYGKEGLGLHEGPTSPNYGGYPWLDAPYGNKGGEKFARLEVDPYTTSKDTTYDQGGHDYHFWYDDIIIADTRIPDPAALI